MENTDEKVQEEPPKPPEESGIGDSININNNANNNETPEDSKEKSPTCFWCKLEMKSGKKIGDLTLAELTEYTSSNGGYILDFTDCKVSKAFHPQISPRPSGPSAPHVLPLGIQPSTRCQHNFALSNGNTVQLSSTSRAGFSVQRRQFLTDRNPLVMLISSLTDIFIAITFTLTCWILIAKAKDMGS